MATKQIDEYYESLAYWKQQALDYEQELRDIKCNTIMNMAAEVEQLKAELRTSELNRQSLWADSVKMADELNYLKAKTDTEITALKSKLNIAVEALEYYADHNNYEETGVLETTDENGEVWADCGGCANKALEKIGGI